MLDQFKAGAAQDGPGVLPAPTRTDYQEINP
jgi:hypothetical protein